MIYQNPIYLKRRRKKLTRPELAIKSGVSEYTVKSLENGSTEIRYAKLDTLINLAKALNCKVSDFLPSEKCI